MSRAHRAGVGPALNDDVRGWQFDETGAGWPLRQVPVADRAPGPNEVVLAVRAVALNARDVMVARGAYGGVPVGSIPCSDAAGDIVAVGRDVIGLQAGDRVTSVFAPDWPSGTITRAALRTTLGAGHLGVLAEQVVLPATAVLPMATGLSYVEACTLPCAGLTAWHALFELGTRDGSRHVLTLGSGGVSTFAIQFARAAGAQVIATTSQQSKRARLTTIGAQQVINYREVSAWGDAVRRLTPGEEGADLVVEVGGHGTLEQSMRAVRPGGTIALIGVLAGAAPVDLRPLLLRDIRLQGTLVGSREMFVRMNAAVSAWGLRPVIDRVFAFDDAPAAYAYLDSGVHVGKVVIDVSG